MEIAIASISPSQSDFCSIILSINFKGEYMKIILIAFLGFVALFGAEVNESNLAASIAKCEAGDGKICDDISYFYSKKMTSSRGSDIEAEKLYLEYSIKACNLRYGGGCLGAASAYGEKSHYNKNTPQDYAKRLDYLTKGCEYNEPNSCNLLGNTYLRELRSKSGAEKKATELKAKRFYQKACDLGSKSGCRGLKDL